MGSVDRRIRMWTEGRVHLVEEAQASQPHRTQPSQAPHCGLHVLHVQRDVPSRSRGQSLVGSVLAAMPSVQAAAGAPHRHQLRVECHRAGPQCDGALWRGGGGQWGRRVRRRV